MGLAPISVQGGAGKGVDSHLEEVVDVLSCQLLTNARVLHNGPVGGDLQDIVQGVFLVQGVLPGHGGQQLQGLDKVVLRIGDGIGDHGGNLFPEQANLVQ